MIPVIKRMSDNVDGLELRPLAWALCFGADYGGMGTLIGSKNVVMAGAAAEAGYPVSFMSFFRIGWPMMWICLVISVSYLTLMSTWDTRERDAVPLRAARTKVRFTIHRFAPSRRPETAASRSPRLKSARRRERVRKPTFTTHSWDDRIVAS